MPSLKGRGCGFFEIPVVSMYPHFWVILHPGPTLGRHTNMLRSCYCLGMAPRAKLLKKSTRLLHLIGDKAQAATCNSREAART